MTRKLFDIDVSRQAKAILDRHVEAAIAAVYGQDAATAEGWKLAITLGFVDPKAPAATIPQQAYTFGLFMAHATRAETPGPHQRFYGMTQGDFVAAIAKQPIPQTWQEMDASAAARRAGEWCRGLGNKVGATIGSKLIEADEALAKEQRQIIQDVVGARYGDQEAQERLRQRGRDQGKPEGFYDDAYRKGIDRVRSDLGHATNDWSRDFTRIAQTETEKAVQEGLSDGWKQQEIEQAEEQKRPVAPVHVYKLPRLDACKHCQRLHLDGGFPRIFTLDSLAANGTNVGRRAADWQPVIGPAHPYCHCELVRLPRFVLLPKEWRSGMSAPNVVGADGMLVIGSAA